MMVVTAAVAVPDCVPHQLGSDPGSIDPVAYNATPTAKSANAASSAPTAVATPWSADNPDGPVTRDRVPWDELNNAIDSILAGTFTTGHVPPRPYSHRGQGSHQHPNRQLRAPGLHPCRAGSAVCSDEVDGTEPSTLAGKISTRSCTAWSGSTPLQRKAAGRDRGQRRLGRHQRPT